MTIETPKKREYFLVTNGHWFGVASDTGQIIHDSQTREECEGMVNSLNSKEQGKQGEWRVVSQPEERPA